jgi:hypothetical protein
MSSKMAQRWIKSYNRQHSQELQIYEPLASNLFLVEVMSNMLELAIQRLWALSPLLLAGQDEKRASKVMLSHKSVVVEDRLASVNFYMTSFKPTNPVDFRQLVYFQIREGSPGLYGVLDTVFLQFGKIVRRYLSTGEDFFRILFLVETTRRTFATKIRVSYGDSHSEEITVEVIDRDARCGRCFAQTHKTPNCTYVANSIVQGKNFKRSAENRNHGQAAISAAQAKYHKERVVQARAAEMPVE